MIAVRLGQQRSQAVGSGFESLSCQIFLRFTLSIFWCPILVKQWRVPLRNFLALWDKKFSMENLDTTPPPRPSYSNFFGTRNQCNSKGLPYGNFRHCETENFRRKLLILPPPLLSINFFATGNFLKHSAEGLNHEIFRHCETKNFRRKILILPPVIHKLFRYRKFLKHSKEGFPCEIFRHCETKNFDKKSWHNPLKHKSFWYSKLVTP